MQAASILFQLILKLLDLLWKFFVVMQKLIVSKNISRLFRVRLRYLDHILNIEWIGERNPSLRSCKVFGTHSQVEEMFDFVLVGFQCINHEVLIPLELCLCKNDGFAYLWLVECLQHACNHGLAVFVHCFLNVWVKSIHKCFGLHSLWINNKCNFFELLN